MTFAFSLFWLMEAAISSIDALDSSTLAACSLAAWLMDLGVAPARYVAAQGTALGRAGRVHVMVDGGTLWIGGHVVPVVTGEARL